MQETKQKKKGFKAVVKEARQCFKRLENEKIWVFTDKALNEKLELYEKFSDLIHTTEADMDFIYEQIVNCLDLISDSDIKSIAEAQDLMHEGVDGHVDVYTANLTSWLASNIDHVYYLTRALEEHEPKDGFEALALAQYLAIEEIWQEVIQIIEGTLK